MIVLVGLTIIIFLLLFSANAEARRGGFIIFGWGEHISPVVDLPNPLYEKKTLDICILPLESFLFRLLLGMVNLYYTKVTAIMNLASMKWSTLRQNMALFIQK